MSLLIAEGLKLMVMNKPPLDRSTFELWKGLNEEIVIGRLPWNQRYLALSLPVYADTLSYRIPTSFIYLTRLKSKRAIKQSRRCFGRLLLALLPAKQYSRGRSPTDWKKKKETRNSPKKCLSEELILWTRMATFAIILAGVVLGNVDATQLPSPRLILLGSTGR